MSTADETTLKTFSFFFFQSTPLVWCGGEMKRAGSMIDQTFQVDAIFSFYFSVLDNTHLHGSSVRVF